MSEKTKNIPKLRFPEFVNDGAWVEKKISDIANIIMGQSPDSNTYNTVQDGKPLIQGNADILNRETNPRIWTTELTKECQEGDIILTVRAPVGAVAKSFHNACIGRGVCAIQPKESSEFLYQFLLTQEDKWDKLSQGSTFVAINSNEIRNFKLNIPSPNEQQKIADFLSSVDSLILAQSQKVELLKEHKKGLMQNLFPREGESVPRLRFPEFVNDGEWSKKQLVDIVISESSSIALNKLNIQTSGYPVYGADSIVGYIDNFQHKEEYVSIVKDGSGVGRINLCKSHSSILGTLACLKSNNQKLYDLKWIYYLLYTIDFSVYIKGTGIPHIYYSDFKHENITIPKLDEQQKIADCLSSLDELITSSTKKVELLKEHKKGLMQQLFPSKEVD